MSARRLHRLALVAAGLAAITALPGFQCRCGDRAREAPVASPAPRAPALAPPPPLVLTADEERIIAALEDFYEGLTEAMERPEARSEDPEVVAATIKRFADPALARFAALTPVYRALDEDRERTVLRVFMRRNMEMLHRFMVATSAWSAQFEPPDKARQFKPILRAVLLEWHRRDALWVLRAWSEEAVTEITETLLTDEEQQVWRRDELARRGAHPEVEIAGRRERPTAESDCLRCHAAEARGLAVRVGD